MITSSSDQFQWLRIVAPSETKYGERWREFPFTFGQISKAIYFSCQLFSGERAVFSCACVWCMRRTHLLTTPIESFDVCHQVFLNILFCSQRQGNGMKIKLNIKSFRRGEVFSFEFRNPSAHYRDSVHFKIKWHKKRLKRKIKHCMTKICSGNNYTVHIIILFFEINSIHSVKRLVNGW